MNIYKPLFGLIILILTFVSILLGLRFIAYPIAIKCRDNGKYENMVYFLKLGDKLGDGQCSYGLFEIAYEVCGYENYADLGLRQPVFYLLRACMRGERNALLDFHADYRNYVPVSITNAMPKIELDDFPETNVLSVMVQGLSADEKQPENR